MVTGNESGCVQCPVCAERIPLYAVEMHASDCAEKTFDNNNESGCVRCPDNNDVIILV